MAAEQSGVESNRFARRLQKRAARSGREECERRHRAGGGVRAGGWEGVRRDGEDFGRRRRGRERAFKRNGAGALGVRARASRRARVHGRRVVDVNRESSRRRWVDAVARGGGTR